MHSPGHIADTDEQAREQLCPHQASSYTRIGRERGWAPLTRDPFEQAAARDGALFVGSPETVAQKIAWAARTLGLSRFHLKYSIGTLPHESGWSRCASTARKSSRGSASSWRGRTPRGVLLG